MQSGYHFLLLFQQLFLTEQPGLELVTKLALIMEQPLSGEPALFSPAQLLEDGRAACRGYGFVGQRGELRLQLLAMALCQEVYFPGFSRLLFDGQLQPLLFALQFFAFCQMGGLLYFK